METYYLPFSVVEPLQDLHHVYQDPKLQGHQYQHHHQHQQSTSTSTSTSNAKKCEEKQGQQSLTLHSLFLGADHLFLMN